ncbi:MAG: SUMF1/EgtB/PvdO family nonheme iron enzyme [Nitrospira sp.]|nr:SUMF1/EgtB/PvdO family nonheme iron enzyme [Nitrospira sp.]
MTTNHFDVFLSYHWRDHAYVEALARQLREQQLTVFLDRWYLTPGQSWPKELEATLAHCRAVAVCIGQGEMGPWQQREQYLALECQVAAERQGQTFPVIPVLLPGAEPPLGFLSQLTWVDFRTRLDDPVLLHALVSAVHGQPPGPDALETVRQTLATICPYRGLLYFREEDAPFFFGREAAIAQLTGAVQQHHLVAVVGASGSGKSSVVRAGLVPELRKSRERVWEVATLVPTDRPVHALAAVLMPFLEPDMSEVTRLREMNQLAEDLLGRKTALRDVVDRVLAKQPGTDRLLLIADQWEELFTLCKDDAARRCFIDNILDATATTKLSVVLTLRGDFFGRAITDYRPLSDRVQGAQVNLGPMKRDELRLAIEEPAKKVKLTFQAGLVDLMLGQAGDEPGKLPLLEFVLRRLWEDRRGGELHHEAYTAMGQLEGAIAHKAESVFVTLNEADQHKVQQIFLHLVRPGEGEADTRRRATFADVGEGLRRIVNTLADERLLVTNRMGDEEETVEVSHEALISQWQRVQTWLNEYREFLLWRERLRGHVKDWQHNKQDENTLLRGTLLGEAQRQLTQRVGILTDQEQGYIRDSVAAHERTAQAARRRAEHELAQANRLAEEAAKREEAERARAEAADRARRRQRAFSLALLILLLVGLFEAWLWQKGYDLGQAALATQSLVGSIYVPPEMTQIPGGSFQQGDVEKLGDVSRNPVRSVTLKPFAMGQYEVTFDEYDGFAIATERRLPQDHGWGRGKRPVINVSWEDAKAYAEWLSKQTGKHYRLPTESEWEYAARSGAKQERWAGTSEESELRAYAVFAENSGNQTLVVGTKKANGFSLYDMSGNMWEWVEDCGYGTYEGAPNDGSAWLETHEGNCQLRVLRGGSWSGTPVDLRASYRNCRGTTVYRNTDLGFRLVQDIP